VSLRKPNRERGQAALVEAIAAGGGGEPGDFERWKALSRAALRLALGRDDETVGRFEAIRYRRAGLRGSPPQHVLDEERAVGVREGIALLEGALLEVEAHAAVGPAIDVGGLHPWFAGTAAALWDSGAHRTAVQEAARTVELQLRAKLGVSEGRLSQLATDAFNPKPGPVRLRFTEFEDGSESWTNAHQGAMHFGQGCAMRIRNLLTHGREPDEPEALESLAALSLLARWIDDAVVVRETPSHG